MKRQRIERKEIDLEDNERFIRSLAEVLSQSEPENLSVEHKKGRSYNHCGHVDILYKEQGVRFLITHSYQSPDDEFWDEYTDESLETTLNDKGQWEFELTVIVMEETSTLLLHLKLECMIKYLADLLHGFGLGVTHEFDRDDETRCTLGIRTGAVIRPLQEICADALKFHKNPEDVMFLVPSHLVKELFKIKWK